MCGPVGTGDAMLGPDNSVKFVSFEKKDDVPATLRGSLDVRRNIRHRFFVDSAFI
jgi:hypothetical protein